MGNKARDDSNKASDDPLALAALITMGAVASELLRMVGNEWTGSPSAAPMATVPKTESGSTESKPIVPLSVAAKQIEPPPTAVVKPIAPSQPKDVRDGMTPHQRRVYEAFPPYYHATYLRPHATATVPYFGRTHTVVPLVHTDWPVVTMLVENMVGFVEIINTWSGCATNRMLWRAEEHNRVRTAMLGQRPGCESLPCLESFKEALSLGPPQLLWTVEQHARIAAGGALLEVPPNRVGTPTAIVVHRLKSSKSHEPVVEAYWVQDCDDAGKPLLAPHLIWPMRFVLSFHGLVNLAANSRVWALVTSPLDGSPQIVRVLPRRLSPTPPEVPNRVHGNTLLNCQGLDIKLDNGERQDICRAALYSYPRPRPRKKRKHLLKKPYNGVYFQNPYVNWGG
jgi:hypothetical protein